MKRQMLPKSMVLMLLGLSISTAAHQRDWQTGKLLDTDRNRYFAGTFTPPGPNGPGQFGYPLYRAFQDYVIDVGTYVYVAEERVRPKSKPVNLVINAAVKYAIEKRKLYVIDNDGKEHEAQIVKQILKQ